jgi:hypothetical protein
MSRGKPINVGSKWMDHKGRVWEVVQMLANGRYSLKTAGQNQTPERNANEIRLMKQIAK